MRTKLIQILALAILLLARATSSYSSDFDYTNDSESLVRLTRLVDRLAVASNLKMSFRVVILPLEQVNAFSVSDGRIIFTQGLMRAISDEDELAGAIAHEMGHQIAHAETNATQALAHSGDDEFAADIVAAQVLKKAGYNPACLASMLRVVLQRDGDSFPKAQAKQLSSRIRRIEERVKSSVSSAEAVAGNGAE
jgi:predicted Zn-dependent protease